MICLELVIYILFCIMFHLSCLIMSICFIVLLFCDYSSLPKTILDSFLNLSFLNSAFYTFVLHFFPLFPLPRHHHLFYCSILNTCSYKLNQPFTFPLVISTHSLSFHTFSAPHFSLVVSVPCFITLSPLPYSLSLFFNHKIYQSPLTPRNIFFSFI